MFVIVFLFPDYLERNWILSNIDNIQDRKMRSVLRSFHGWIIWIFELRRPLPARSFKIWKLRQLPCEQFLQDFKIFRAFLRAKQVRGKCGKFLFIIKSCKFKSFLYFFPSRAQMKKFIDHCLKDIHFSLMMAQ